MKALSLLAPALLVCAAPAFANVTVASPSNGASLVSPFWLSASSSSCSSQAIAAMGYSLDNSSSTTIVYATSVGASVEATVGKHTLHVKSWGQQGASCVTDVSIVIASSSGNLLPANAVAAKALQKLPTWKAVNDTGAGNGTSTGRMSMVASPSLSGAARKFVTAYSNSAGERYYVSFGTDSSPRNFLYDVWIYLASPSSDIANLEMDLNQTMSNGETVIFGFQCDGYTSTWDYTANEGSPQNPYDVWRHSAAYCNPREWSTDTWHHVQISYSRDGQGYVTYHSVWLDGVQENIEAKVPSAFALGWGPALLTNFQVDGLGGYGSATVYMDNLNIYRW